VPLARAVWKRMVDANAYSGSKAQGFPIQTRHHFRCDTATEMAR